ncbi:MAG: 4Fe-4S dicluster domain-containing protein [Desulfobacterales bacterium]|nr:4Fe-4S dicluster domain-containing protein [Desulfobacterales bacterium]
MKQVVVHPERCVGCLQCMLACATVHSQSQRLISAILETPRPKPRVHVGVGRLEEGFPNRCRHCDPAPCMLACLPGAIYRDAATQTVLIDADRCINCASCAMVCPFGVLRYHPDPLAPPTKTVAVKCDNCIGRQHQGLIPACVEACRTRALTFETLDAAMKRKTDAVSRTVSTGAGESEAPEGVALLHQIKKVQARLRT